MTSIAIFHSPGFQIAPVREFVSNPGVTMTALGRLSELPASADIQVVLLDEAMADGERHLPEGHPEAIYLALGLNGAPIASEPGIYLQLSAAPAPATLGTAVHRAIEHAIERMEKRRIAEQMTHMRNELDQIHKIGVALSTVRDHDVLLPMILTKAREISRSDAGSLYLLDRDPEQGDVLRWKLAQNDSIPVSFEEKTLPVTESSLAGYVALTGETLVIDDAYRLPDGVPYSFNTSFDQQTGYLTRSQLLFPMTTHAGEILGVLQLINRRRAGSTGRITAETAASEVIPFDPQTIRSMQSLAGSAAVAVENNYLYESIERLFEGFVTASVTAIEQRDPTTSGHSFRVADLTVELARLVDRLENGPFAPIRFTADQIRELRYASLLHDFGKVGVREKVLVKEKKLYPLQMDLIRSRFEFVIRTLEEEAARRKLDFLLQHGREGYEAFAAEVDRKLQEDVAACRGDLQFVVHSNEPTVLPEGEFQHLQLLAQREFVDLSGNRRPFIEAEEVRRLSIRKGNLDAEERGEIESHVTHTFEFLSKIPWTSDLQSVPEIAYAHHEKLNGRGYPRGLDSLAIPVQSRMMTVSDIYDALTASDRPYKRAISTERALDILGMEVEEGLLDRELVRLFIEAKIYEKAGVLRL